MHNVCANCGLYRVDKTIELKNGEAYALCPECGHRHQFLRLPLLLVSGASATGKTTVCQHLISRRTDVVLLDSDILWQPEFNQPENNYRRFFETWLRMCKNIGQSGRPVMLFGAGLGVPDNIEPCLERRYFSTVHYLAFVCSETELTRRLQARPSWRDSGTAEFVTQQIQYNNWLRERGRTHPGEMTLLDTSETTEAEAVQQVGKWVEEKLKMESRL